MTALNYMQVGTRGFLMQDSASIDADGVVVSLDRKGVALPAWQGHMATTGSTCTGDAILQLVIPRFEEIDDLCERGEAGFHAARLEMIRQFPDEFRAPWGVLIVGWSVLKQSPRAVYFGSNVDVYFEKDFTYWAEPFPGDELWKEWRDRLELTGGLHSFKPETHGLFKIEGQRQMRIAHPDEDFAKNCHFVGGSVYVAEIGSAGVSQRIIHRWSEDRVGERIDPSKSGGIVVPLKAPNRRERRRLASLGKGAVA